MAIAVHRFSVELILFGIHQPQVLTGHFMQRMIFQAQVIYLLNVLMLCQVFGHFHGGPATLVNPHPQGADIIQCQDGIHG